MGGAGLKLEQPRLRAETRMNAQTHGATRRLVPHACYYPPRKFVFFHQRSPRSFSSPFLPFRCHRACDQVPLQRVSTFILPCRERFVRLQKFCFEKRVLNKVIRCEKSFPLRSTNSARRNQMLNKFFEMYSEEHNCINNIVDNLNRRNFVIRRPCNDWSQFKVL